MKLFGDENTFWFTLWTTIGVLLLALATIVNYNIHLEDKIVAELIREGHDPLKLECVYGNSDAKHCSVYALENLNEQITDIKREVQQSAK